MKPAICYLCRKLAIDEPKNDKGDWLKFVNYHKDTTGSLGHPEGFVYVCNEHISAAKLLLEKTSEEARSILLEQFKDLDKPQRIISRHRLPIWSRISNFFK